MSKVSQAGRGETRRPSSMRAPSCAAHSDQRQGTALGQALCRSAAGTDRILEATVGTHELVGAHEEAGRETEGCQGPQRWCSRPLPSSRRSLSVRLPGLRRPRLRSRTCRGHLNPGLGGSAHPFGARCQPQAPRLDQGRSAQASVPQTRQPGLVIRPDRDIVTRIHTLP